MDNDSGKDLDPRWSDDSLRKELGLPALNEAKEALRRRLDARLAGAHYPIRNEEELRRALAGFLRPDELVGLVARREYLFTRAEQLSEVIAERAAAAWDLAARCEHREAFQRRRANALRGRMARWRPRHRTACGNRDGTRAS